MDQDSLRITTFNELLDQYILEKPLSEASKASYRRILNCFTQDTGITRITDVSFSKLLRWRMDVLTRSSDITWNTYLRHMRALWRFAIHRGYGGTSIDHFAELNWGRNRVTRKKTVTTDQLRTIMSVLSGPECSLEPCWFWKLVVKFLYFTGVRRRQLVSITWGDVDLDQGTIHLSAEGEKTGRSRDIPIHQALFEDLTEYRDLMKGRFPAFFKPEAQLFNVTLFYERYRGRQLTEDQVSGFFRRLSDAAGFKVSAHMLRHTMATEIAKTGQIKSLQQILGHANIHTTMSFYVHPDIKQLRKTLDRLGGI